MRFARFFRRCFWSTLLLLLGVAAVRATPAAQAQDVQVAFDDAGAINVIDAELRERLGLFGEVEGFEEARLFRQAGGAGETYELVIRYRVEAQSLRERRRLSALEVARLRRRVRVARTEDGRIRPRARLQDGRYRFLANTTLLGGIEGALFAASADPENGDVVLASAFLGVTAGFFVPMLATRNEIVTESEATLTGYGGVQGIAHGVALGLLFADAGEDGRGVAAVTGALALAESVVGMRLARSTAMRSGTAETMTLGGLYGTGLGAYAGLLLAGGNAGDATRRASALGVLAGSAGGAYGGYRLGQAAGYTQGDARIFGTAGLLGAQVASATLAVAHAEESTRPFAGTLIAGTLGGLALGHAMVRDRDFGEVQGNIAALGALAGSLAGGATGIIVDADDGTSAVLSTLGAIGGFAGTYFAYRGDAQAGPERGGSNLEIGLGSGAALPGGEGSPLGAATPALNVRLSF